MIKGCHGFEKKKKKLWIILITGLRIRNLKKSLSRAELPRERLRQNSRRSTTDLISNISSSSISSRADRPRVTYLREIISSLYRGQECLPGLRCF